MFILLSSWLKVIARVHSVHLMNVVRRQMAANPQTKPVDLGRESACIQLPLATPTMNASSGLKLTTFDLD